MCGIAGIINYQNQEKDISKLESMLRAIRHRGPDDSGIYLSAHASLGNVRLNVFDQASARQPLSDPSGRFWIVFNGQIFNYEDLRAELGIKGYRLNTPTDTEVIVQLYSIYGSKCPELLNGEFAFAIWDKKKEELFLARDRTGIRPLFFHNKNGVFTFSSEIKSLFRNDSIYPEFSPENLSQVYTFWATITPNTAFKNIYEISPGHYAIYNRNGFKTEKYWSLQFDNINSSLSLSDAIDEFDHLFRDSVELRLRADVDVAAYLSGGIDSSATVAYIKDIGQKTIQTFSVGFRDKSFDESSYQDEAVKAFNTQHQSFICSSNDIADIFPKVVWHSEMPLTRTAPAPMYLLSKLVNENNIKVVITGEGSDELLAGYDIFKETVIRNFWASQPNSVMRPMLLKRLYPYIPQINNAEVNILKFFFGYKLENTNNPFYSHLLRWNNSNHIKKHFSSHFKELLKDYSPLDQLELGLPENFNSWNSLSKAQWLESTIFMSGYLLSSQGDRMGMANSVEARYPFLDHRIIEFCTKLPESFKLKGLTEKYLLKKVLNNKIPAGILKRTKQPYRAPVKNVFLSDDNSGYLSYMLSEDYTKRAGIFDPESLGQVLLRIRKTGISSEIDDMLLSSVVSTHLLYYQFIENNNEEFRGEKLKHIRITEDFKE